MTAFKRRNIYLTEQQDRAFAHLGLEYGVAASELIRRALDAYLAAQPRGIPGGSLRRLRRTLLEDAEGYVHATITRQSREDLAFEDHDISHLEWIFDAQTLEGHDPISHSLWTGCLYDYHPQPYITYETPALARPNLLTRLILALQVVTDEDFLTHRADTILADFDLESLIGTTVKYRLTTLYNPFEPPPGGYDSAFDDSNPPWYQLYQGPNVDTMTLDRPMPITSEEEPSV